MAAILFVDDETDLVEVFAEFLRDAGHEVRTATGGAEALGVLATWTPDVVVLDLNMPDMPGGVVIDEMSKLGSRVRRLPVVLLSGNASLEQAASKMGTTYYASKPVSLDRFLTVLEGALRDRRAPSRPSEFGVEPQPRSETPRS